MVIINVIFLVLALCSPIIIVSGIFQLTKKKNKKYGWTLISIGLIVLIVYVSYFMYNIYTAPPAIGWPG